jgi:hypothetical protein
MAAETGEALRRSQPLIHGALEEGLQQGGCAVCRALRKAEERSLFAFLYEHLTSPTVVQEFLDSGGFCPRHLRMAAQMAKAAGSIGPFEIAKTCEWMVGQAKKVIEQPGQQRQKTLRFAKRNPKSVVVMGSACVFCQETHSKERQLVEALEPLIGDKKLAGLLRRHGLCYRHGQIAVACWKQESARRWLGDTMREFLSELTADLKEFQRKHDHRHRDEPFGREINVVRRALEFLLGLEDGAAGGPRMPG